MSEDKKIKELLERVSSEPSYVAARERLDKDDLERVDRILRNFIEQFVAPIDQLVDSVKGDPKMLEEVRRSFASGSIGRS